MTQYQIKKIFFIDCTKHWDAASEMHFHSEPKEEAYPNLA